MGCYTSARATPELNINEGCKILRLGSVGRRDSCRHICSNCRILDIFRAMIMLKPLIKVSVIVLITACTGESQNGVQGAKGETPIRYVVCSTGETNCFVAARFKNIESCERHKSWSEMLCDSRTQPGKMICEKDNGQQVTHSYCTL